MLVQVDKILLSTAEIRLERSVGADRPLATHWVAGVGKEVVKFDPTVKLTGKAEAYLLSLLLAQIFTLSKCLSASMQRYPTKARVDWLMQKDSKGEALDPSQIVLLVAACDYVKTIEQAMNTSKGDNTAMTKSFDLTKTQLADLIKLKILSITIDP